MGKVLGDLRPDLKTVTGPQSGGNEVTLEGKVAVEPVEGYKVQWDPWSVHWVTESSFGYFCFSDAAPLARVLGFMVWESSQA